MSKEIATKTEKETYIKCKKCTGKPVIDIAKERTCLFFERIGV